nr:hypothetical protein [Tanacetum cinerariifolium]
TKLEIITPANPAERGCQLSLLVHERGRELFDFLAAQGIVADWREPNYREGAVLAALDELQRRGQPAPEDATLRPLLEAAVWEQQAAQAKLEKPAAGLAEKEVPVDEQPVLYTPGVIVLFSVLFNT